MSGLNKAGGGGVNHDSLEKMTMSKEIVLLDFYCCAKTSMTKSNSGKEGFI